MSNYSTSVVKERIFQWWDYPVFTFLTIWSLWAIYSFLVYWFSNPDWSSQPLSHSILTVMLLVGALMLRGQWEKMGTGTADKGTQMKRRR